MRPNPTIPICIADFVFIIICFPIFLSPKRTLQTRTIFNLPKCGAETVLTLLLLVFAFAQAFKHGEARFLGVGNGKRLQFDRRIEAGNDFAYRLAAGRTNFLRGCRDGPAQREVAAANGAITFAQLIFIDRHIPYSTLTHFWPRRK